MNVIKYEVVDFMCKKTLTLTVSLLTCFVFVILFLFWSEYNAQFYESQEITETCNTLNLTLSDFCEASNKVNHEDLEQALSLEYLSIETTYYDLMGSIQEQVYFNFSRGTCVDINPNVNNLCPEPSRCDADYSCYVDTPVQRIYFDIRTDGILDGVSVPNTDS